MSSTREQRARHKYRHPDYFRDHKMRTKYGITADEYDALSESQGHVCAICGEPETAAKAGKSGETRRLAVDHDHATGRIRGLLCARCNTGIGKFNDNADILAEAVAYLRRFELR